MKRFIHLLTALCTLGILASAAPVSAQTGHPNSTKLEGGWEFLRGDLGDVWEAARPLPKSDAPEAVPHWREISLPHCFNDTDAVAPDVNYYQGPGWYRSTIEVKNPLRGGRTILHFEGAGQKTDVWIYTEKVGSHVGGYDEWSVDITQAVERFLGSTAAERFGGKVPVVIRCDNSRDVEMIPSDLSDFNLYGGIYRSLRLVYTPALALSSVRVEATVDEKGAKGHVAISGGFANHAEGTDATLNIRVLDPTGRVVKHTNRQITDFADQEFFAVEIPRPRLWSPSRPDLYTCEVRLDSPAGEMTCREVFGFRHFEFREGGPFYLNGEQLLLRGTHRHEDHAGVGAAMMTGQMTREMEMIKAMGVNFIRLGHYQQSRTILDECDRLGILVWEEIPWCRGGVGHEPYREQALRMLSTMIAQHRNHPSVIMWGLGNENDWPGDFAEFDRAQIREFMTELHNLSHEIDPSRPTCIRRCDFCSDIPDVYSPSIWAGWYRGLYTDYEKFTLGEKERVKRFLHVEWGGDSHAGRHAEYDYTPIVNAADCEALKTAYAEVAGASKALNDWSESYVVDLVDWHLSRQERMPWLTGTAYWPFKDFSTPLRPDNPVPYVNQKGVVARDLAPKEVYHVFRSYWTSEPMLHIYGHTWPVRWGGVGEDKLIKVYSNCDEVELFLNGESLGARRREPADFPAAGLRWSTPLKGGTNVVRAIGAVGSGRKRVIVEDEIAFDYETRPFGEPAEIRARVTKSGDGVVWVEAELVDINGVTSLEAQNFVSFEAAGDGELVKDMGTPTASSRVQAVNGRARIAVRTRGGRTLVAVKSDHLKTFFVEVESVEVQRAGAE